MNHKGVIIEESLKNVVILDTKIEKVTGTPPSKSAANAMPEER